jgi:DNA replicative helicase MCM subunit Mcm2 (Cdc46/Mcm family)
MSLSSISGTPIEQRRKRMKDQASYVCDSCGEEIVVPIDLSAGASQEYVEDCPVCCRPNVIHVEIGEDEDVRVWAERE